MLLALQAWLFLSGNSQCLSRALSFTIEASLAIDRAWAWNPRGLGSSVTLLRVTSGKSLHHTWLLWIHRAVIRARDHKCKCWAHCLCTVSAYSMRVFLFFRYPPQERSRKKNWATWLLSGSRPRDHLWFRTFIILVTWTFIQEKVQFRLMESLIYAQHWPRHFTVWFNPQNSLRNVLLLFLFEEEANKAYGS